MRALVLVSSLLLGCQAAPGASNGSAQIARAWGGPGKRLSKEAPAKQPKGHSSEVAPQARLEKVRNDPPQPTLDGERDDEPVPIPEGTVVLHVGSSNAEALGRDLKKELEDYGIKYVLKAQQSTYIPQWAGERMGLRRLVAKHNPDLVLVTLGGNEVGIPNPSNRAGAIQRLVKIIGDRPCLWIGTPKWKGIPQTGIHQVIRENCAPCYYVDTDALVPDIKPHSDGVHPTLAERRRWAERMLQWLQHNRNPDGARPWDFKESPELPP
jgi:hypothetical protein